MANGRPFVLLHTIYQQVPALFQRGNRRDRSARSRAALSKGARAVREFPGARRPGTGRRGARSRDAVFEGDDGGQQEIRHAGSRRAARGFDGSACARSGTKIEVPIDVPAPERSLPMQNRRAKSRLRPRRQRRLRKLRRALRFVFRFRLNRRPRPRGGSRFRTRTPPSLPAALPKISPNGAGVPITERVPASSGSPAPISLPSPSRSGLRPRRRNRPAAPVRIPFKVTSAGERSLPAAGAAVAITAAAPLIFPRGWPAGLKISSALAVLRGIPPFQLSGAIEHVPEDAVIEFPFAIMQPQLSLGRVAISPAQFHAAMPAEYRALLQARRRRRAGLAPVAGNSAESA